MSAFVAGGGSAGTGARTLQIGAARRKIQLDWAGEVDWIGFGGRGPCSSFDLGFRLSVLDRRRNGSMGAGSCSMVFPGGSWIGGLGGLSKD